MDILYVGVINYEIKQNSIRVWKGQERMLFYIGWSGMWDLSNRVTSGT